MKQTILGAGGAIGAELAKALKGYTSEIRLAGRNPKRINSTDELFKADLSIKEQVFSSVEGSEVVYLTIGLEYKLKVWQRLWPSIIRNTIDACLQHNSKLVFFDNVYAIGGDNVNHITENSPISPSSKKGEVRAEVDRMILDASERKGLNAIIARAPDFFSDYKQNSVLMNLVYDNLAKGKRAQWFCNAKVVHSFGYAPDLAMGTALLGNTDDAYNQIWNLPTDSERLTGEDWINLFAYELNSSNKYTVLPPFGVKIIGLFIPVINEIHEMLYQYDRDYFFDSSKFNSRFGHLPKSNKEAVKETVARLKENSGGQLIH